MKPLTLGDKKAEKKEIEKSPHTAPLSNVEVSAELDASNWLTIKDASKVLGVTPVTFRKMRDSNRLSGVRTSSIASIRMYFRPDLVELFRLNMSIL